MSLAPRLTLVPRMTLRTVARTVLAAALAGCGAAEEAAPPSPPGASADPWMDGDIKTAAVRKLAELKKETSERAAKNEARYEKFSDRIKALIKQFSAGLIEADELLDQGKLLAKEILAEDQAHVGSGLNERAYGIAAILEKFVGPVGVVSEPPPPPYEGSRAPLSAMHQAAADIDALYTSEATAPPYWQDKTELRKELRGQVRRMIQHLGLEGWQKQVPLEVETYAVIHYSRP
jgi:hypothetical protein